MTMMRKGRVPANRAAATKSRSRRERVSARTNRATPIQVLLAWCIRDGHTIAIPRTGHPDHTLENAGANALLLDEEDLALIDRQYAPPTRKMPLDEQ